MSNQIRKIQLSLQNVILYSSIFIGIILALISGIFFPTQITSIVSNQYKQFTQSQTKLFSSNISQDILTGSYAEVNRKCLELYNDYAIEYVQIITTDQKQICNLSKANNQKKILLAEDFTYFDESKQKPAAKVQIGFNLDSLELLISSTTKWLYFWLFIFTVALITLNYFILSKIFNGLKSQLNVISNFNLITSELIKDASTIPTFVEIKEAQSVIEQFKKLAERILDQQSTLSKHKINHATDELSKQVAHDIRSPLSALNMLLNHTTHLPEAQRVLTRNAIQRINDIANNLLNKNIANIQTTHENKSIILPELISPLVSMLLSEKRMQYREKDEITIEENLNEAYGLFAKINSTELKRVLSNLITNSVESLSQNGKIIVRVYKVGKHITIEIRDNGKGIPQNILSQLGQKGISFGKETSDSGSGLGVFHAIQTVKSFGGDLTIKSQINDGTTVTISIPICETPDWFCENIFLDSNTMFVSLDDDSSIHQIWKQRLTSLNAQAGFKSFTSAKSFADWYYNCGKKSLFAIDYELLNQEKTGLDIIEELGIQKNAVLVTSRYSENSILERCAKLRLKIIPKSMAEHVPILTKDTTKLSDDL